ncbi:MAG: citrate/2-methylcitrate synthase [Pseudomonadota bacterium]|nr:citrate/2-methylcitrate synthase [Pseudomonadota bacterium]
MNASTRSFRLSRTRYHGTDVDGARLRPERLEVRGRDLNDLIGRLSFEQALWHLWFGAAATAPEHLAVRVRLAQLASGFMQPNPTVTAGQAAAAAGTAPIFAVAAGLLRGVDEVRQRSVSPTGPCSPTWDDDFDTLLACVAAVPALLRATLESADPGSVDCPGAGPARQAPCDDPPAFSHGVLHAAGATGADPLAAARVMDALLVGWHAGFGYLTPTVLVTRCAIGTGVDLAHAVAAGCLASGPSHVGAAFDSMRWLAGIGRNRTAPPLACEPALSDADACQVIDRAFDGAAGRLAGFGHPLFEVDPRPPRLRELWRAWSFEGPAIRWYDAACRRAAQRKGLQPNIDFITAAALLDLGVADPHWAVGVGLCARVAAMATHAVERRRRPAFGQNHRTARAQLNALPTGWL